MNAQTELLLAAMTPDSRFEWERTKPHPPTYTFVDFLAGKGSEAFFSCDRCGSVVMTDDQDTHIDWHEEVSLRHWLLAFLVERIKEKNGLRG